MNKTEILTRVYLALQMAGTVVNKKDFAAQMDTSYANLTSSFRGNETHLTNKFFNKLLLAFPQVNPEFVRNGEEPILLTDSEGKYSRIRKTTEEKAGAKLAEFNYDPMLLVGTIIEQNEIIRRSQEQMDKSLSQIDSLIEILRGITLKG